MARLQKQRSYPITPDLPLNLSQICDGSTCSYYIMEWYQFYAILTGDQTLHI